MRRLLIVGLMLHLIACSSDNPVSTIDDDIVIEEVPPSFNIEVVSGNGQEARQSELLNTPIVIRVTDNATAQPLAGIAISAVPDSESSSVAPSIATTDADGLVSFEWTLGNSFDNYLEISADGAEMTSVYASAMFRYFTPGTIADGWSTDSLDESDPNVQRLFTAIDYMRRGVYPNMHSLLIAHKGSLMLETYLSGQDSQGRNITWSRSVVHEQQSASKSFRSALIGLAIDRGYIQSVDTPISAFFPDQQQHLTGDKAAITLEDFLTMSSGLEWDESGAAAGQSNNSLSRMYGQHPSTWTGFVLSKPLAFPPGTQFVYNTGASLMLDDVVTAASGQTLSQFVFENYFDRIESENVAGVFPAGGGTKTSREMAKLGQIYLDEGMWKDTRVLSADWVRESFQERFTFGNGTGYGYQWWMRTLTTSNTSYRVRYAAGNGGQFIMVIDELDLVVVSTGGNFGSSVSNQFHTMVQDYVLPVFE